jgi:hypothetical protein
MTIQISQLLFNQFMEVRDDGRCNMFDIACVRRVAEDINCHTLEQYIEDNPDHLVRLVFGDFEIINESETADVVEEFEDEINEDTVTITKKEYEQLLEDSKWLSCLESAGVDNWAGYDYAVDLMRENESED